MLELGSEFRTSCFCSKCSYPLSHLYSPQTWNPKRGISVYNYEELQGSLLSISLYHLQSVCKDSWSFSHRSPSPILLLSSQLVPLPRVYLHIFKNLGSAHEEHVWRVSQDDLPFLWIARFHSSLQLINTPALVSHFFNHSPVNMHASSLCNLTVLNSVEINTDMQVRCLLACWCRFLWAYSWDQCSSTLWWFCF